MVTISRNAPSDIGVTVGLASSQYTGVTIPLEIELVNSDGETVFHREEFSYAITGGGEETETCWFRNVPAEKFHMELYPKIRFRDEPPKKP